MWSPDHLDRLCMDPATLTAAAALTSAAAGVGTAAAQATGAFDSEPDLPGRGETARAARRRSRQRRAGAETRRDTLLTGASGAEQSPQNISRKSLLGE